MQKYNHSLIQLVVWIIIAASFSGESKAQENIDWKNRLFAEAPKHWEGYLRFARSLQVSVSSTLYKGANRSLVKKVRSEFKQLKNASLSLRKEFGPKGESTVVEGTNPSYSFKLKRRSPGSGWIITDLELAEQSTTLSDRQKRHQEMQLQTICGCLKLHTLWLPTLIKDPDFIITAIKPQVIDGSPVIRFDFDYPKSDKDYPVKGAIPLKGGWMVLDPEHDWILRDYLVHTGNPETYFIRETFQIREGTGRHPIITGGTEQIIEKGEKTSVSVLAEAQSQTVERSDVPLEEFTLSAFGLLEPPGTRVEGSRLYLWIALVGIVALSIAALIRWQLRRTRTIA